VSRIRITRAGPLATVQDAGRFGMLRHGISASGPMDRAAFERIAGWLGGAGASGIEFTTAGLGFVVEDGVVAAGFDGGVFVLEAGGQTHEWPARAMLQAGDTVEIKPGPAGNYGYVRFDGEIEVLPVLGSRATNLVAGLGGLEGRALREGDVLTIGLPGKRAISHHPRARPPSDGPIGIVWGLHADLFAPQTRLSFLDTAFRISTRLDRMGARLEDGRGLFAEERKLSLVSDAVVPGDIQILGDGTPIVLMRDHQPTGGYPRIATVIAADLDRFAQLRPGAEVRFKSMTVSHAQAGKP
jgi:biotin-dependent carboxylase-like uncharacterized protein